jgi:hypothetical protein
MPSIRDIYPFYLTAEGLQGRSHVVHIQSATVEELWNRQLKRKEPKLVVRFHGRKSALACNKTQAAQLAQLTGTDDYTRWPGHTVTLTPGRAPTGTATILILAAPQQTTAAPAVEPPPAVEEPVSEEPAIEEPAGDAEDASAAEATLRQQVEELGQTLYGGDWDQVRRRNIDRLTQGQTIEADDLTIEQLQTLLDGLQRLQRRRSGS